MKGAQRVHALVREELRPALLSGTLTPEETHNTWRLYVLDEVNRMLSQDVNRGFKSSWMLRKSVRVGAPIETIARLLQGNDACDPWANASEAVRYALLDGHAPYDELMRLLASKRDSWQGNAIVAVFAALAQQWDVAIAVIAAYPGNLPSSNADRAAMVAAIAKLGIPEDRRPEWFKGVLANLFVDQREKLATELLSRAWRVVLESDDRDNILSLDGFDVSITGKIVTDERAEDANMYSWMDGANPLGTDYVANLGQILPKRMTQMRVVGSGDFGMVLIATARRDGRRYAIKLTQLADPLGRLSEAYVKLIQDELRINILLANTPAVANTLHGLPLVNDWVRGRANLVRTFRSIMGRDPPRTAVTSVDGPGIYLAMVMPAFDYALDAWMNAVVMAAGKSDAVYAVASQMLKNFVLVLLGQLYVLRKNLPGFRHSDIKGNNILMREMAATSQYALDITVAGKRLQVSKEDVGGFDVTLSDFGLAVVTGPVAIGDSKRPNRDIWQLGNMLLTEYTGGRPQKENQPITWPRADLILNDYAAKLMSIVDDGTSESIVRVLNIVLASK